MKPILVTGVGGNIGGVGQKIVENLLTKNVAVRALVHKPSEISEALEKRGVEIVSGDLTELADTHRAIEGIDRMYFGMSVSDRYLEATANVAAVARFHKVKAFVNISQMTVSEMSITETTSSPQHKLQWLSEQILNWSGLPVVHVRSTVFLESPLFYRWAIESISKSNELRLPFGNAKTSPVAASDVALTISYILLDPAKHISHVYEITGQPSQDMNAIAKDYSKGLGREIKYADLPYQEWKDKDFASKGFPAHVGNHLATMALLHSQNRYDRNTTDFRKITGQDPVTIEQWVKSKRSEFLQTGSKRHSF
jgi:uncharacterized protein YbjT (DUF2867 family)